MARRVGGSTTSATATTDRAPVAGASDLHDEVERRAELVAHGRHREVEAGGEHHHLEPAQGVGGELAWQVDSEPSWPVFIA